MTIDCDDSAFLEAQLTEVEAQITAYRAAVRAVTSGQTYRLDTGQTSVSVTRANLTELRNMISELMNERALLRQHLGCSGNVVLSPGF
jgi:hypothetical protein